MMECLEVDMMSDSFDRMVNFLVDDSSVRNEDVRAAIAELDDELYDARAAGGPVPLERYRLRRILRAVAAERGMTDQWSNSG